MKIRLSSHKALFTFLLILLGGLWFSYQARLQKEALENSRFIGKLTPGDTLKVINEIHYCEAGPVTESYYFYYPTNSTDMICDYCSEWGWRKWKIRNEGIIEEETYKVSRKAIKYFLEFEKDVINKATGEEGGCTFYEFFTIILKNDTASSAHLNCSYRGFGYLMRELGKNIVSSSEESPVTTLKP